MVDLDAALGKQLFDVAVGEAKAEVPADRQHDHIRREAETGEGRPCNGIGADPASSHDASLAARVCSQQMQQRRERGCDLDSESCLADPGRSRDRHGADVAVQQQLPQQRKLPCPFPPAGSPTPGAAGEPPCAPPAKRSLRGDSSLPSPCSEPASLDRSARGGRSGAARTQAWGHPEPRRHSSPPIATGTVHSVSRTVRPAGRHHVSCSHE
jgi:hypothetical protein